MRQLTLNKKDNRKFSIKGGKRYGKWAILFISDARNNREPWRSVMLNRRSALALARWMQKFAKEVK